MTERQRKYDTTRRKKLATGKAAGEELSPRERIFVSLLRSGYSTAAAAEQLGVSEGSAKQHVHRAYKKLGVKDRAGLLRLKL